MNLFLKHLIRISIIVMYIFLCPGCITSMMARDAIGETAKIKIRSFRTGAKTVAINWIEEPFGNESAIYIHHDADYCEIIDISVKTSPTSTLKLSDSFQTISPTTFFDEAQTLSKLNTKPSNPCTISVAIGVNDSTGFSGLVLKKPSGNIERVHFKMPEDKQPDSKLWFATAIGAPVADAMLLVVSPIIGAAYLQERSNGPVERVVVSFDFEDGSRLETELSHDEAKEIMATQYPETLDVLTGRVMPEWKSVRFWARAALAKLKIDFREERLDCANQYCQLAFSSIKRESANWSFDLRDGTPPKQSLTGSKGDTRFIRFKPIP